jgi:hypothetical protein
MLSIRQAEVKGIVDCFAKALTTNNDQIVLEHPMHQFEIFHWISLRRYRCALVWGFLWANMICIRGRTRCGVWSIRRGSCKAFGGNLPSSARRRTVAEKSCKQRVYCRLGCASTRSAQRGPAGACAMPPARLCAGSKLTVVTRAAVEPAAEVLDICAIRER